MTPPASALRCLVALMQDAARPWWVIGSLAIVAHGAATSVADVDVLLDPEDARRLDGRHALGLAPGSSDGRFRFALHGRWMGAGFPIEFMAGLTVTGPGGWTMVTPETRMMKAIGGVALPGPDRSELLTILHRFGRPKDIARAGLLNA